MTLDGKQWPEVGSIAKCPCCDGADAADVADMCDGCFEASLNGRSAHVCGRDAQ